MHVSLYFTKSSQRMVELNELAGVRLGLFGWQWVRSVCWR
jgi:hypothetical protein